MSRSRPASNPVSYHKHTGQCYVTRAGGRIYRGSDRDQALSRYDEAMGRTEQVAAEPGRTLHLSSAGLPSPVDPENTLSP